MSDTLWTALPDWALVFTLVVLYAILATTLVVMVRMDVKGPARLLHPRSWWVVTFPTAAGAAIWSAVKFGEGNLFGGSILLVLGLVALIVGLLAVRWAIETGDYTQRR